MAKQHNPGFQSLCEEARRKVTEIPNDVVRRRLAERTSFTLLDVREDHEWVQGHLPSAKHLGRGILERDIETVIPDKTREIVLYCGGGYRSALAAESLQKMGYVNVKSMAGGFGEWTAKRFEVSTDET